MAQEIAAALRALVPCGYRNDGEGCGFGGDPGYDLVFGRVRRGRRWAVAGNVQSTQAVT